MRIQIARHEKKLRERTEEYLKRVDKAEIKHVDSEEKTMRQLRASLAKYWKEHQLPEP